MSRPRITYWVTAKPTESRMNLRGCTGEVSASLDRDAAREHPLARQAFEADAAPEPPQRRQVAGDHRDAARQRRGPRGLGPEAAGSERQRRTPQRRHEAGGHEAPAL